MAATVGITNQDTSFFTISSPDNNLGADIGPASIKSLVVTETMGKMDTATITFSDPYHAISRILRFGVKLDLTWGYKAWNERLTAALGTPQTFDLFTQSVQRRGLRVLVTTPSGGGTENGEITYACNAIALDMRGDNKQRSFSSGTRGLVVLTVMSELGVSAPVINFPTSSQTLDDSTAVMQWETNFAFLARIANEWSCVFRLAYTPAGTIAGLFVDPGKISQPGFLSAVGAGGPMNYRLEYKSGARNVISYTWQSHEGENGAGDGGTIVWENGQPVVYRYVIENEQVTSWRLNEDRLREYLEQRNQESGPAAVAAAAQDLLSQQSFNTTVRYFFDQVVGNTAPEGYGLTVNAEMPGCPMIVPPMTVVFGGGFPDKITRSQVYNPFANGAVSPSQALQDVQFFVHQHTHTIDAGGYHSSLEIIDAFTAFTEAQAQQ